jgi:C-terminal processing protease CtpA/Prc
MNGHVFITANYSSDTSIKTGDEILSIDGIPINIKMAEVCDFLSGEGKEIKSTLIDMVTFPRIYWWIYGNANQYRVQTKHKKENIKSTIIKSLQASDYEKLASRNKPVFSLNREFKFIGAIAYLHPGIFINNQSSGNTSEQQTFETNEFISFIDSSFREIHKTKPQNLIIDLRGNPGGDNAFSDPMIAYFATKPFLFCSEFNVKTSNITKQFWKDVKDSSLQDIKNQILTKKDGETFKVSFQNYPPRTDSFRFKGKVFVLVDRYSYSNTVSVAAIVQDYSFGEIIGEPTTDVASSYGATHQFMLPNSQVEVSYPKAFIVRPNGNRKLEGVTPDVIAYDNIFTETDEILDFTLKYIIERK